MNSGNRLRERGGDGGERFSLGHPEFQSFLGALKRHGCNLLVTGEAGDEAFAAMSRRLLGTSTEERVRLLALTNGMSYDAARLLPGDVGVDDPRVRILDHGIPTRFVEADSALPASTQSDLMEFQEEIRGAIEEFEDDAGGLEPAELRVGMVSLCPLVDTYGVDAVAEFARTVGSKVLRVRGMAHYRLSIADDEPLVRELDPEFDARIEVQSANGHPPVHRWHVTEYDLTTPWVEI